MVLCGAAKRDITPPAEVGELHIAGFISPNDIDPEGSPVIKGVHDDINVRALVLSDGSTKIALVSVDVIGMLGDLVYEVKVPLEAWGFPKRNVFLFATHTHASPDTMGLWGPALGFSGASRKYRYFVIDAIISAIMEADKNMVPSVMHVASGTRPDLIENYRSPGHVAGTIRLLSFEGQQTGGTIASVWTFDAQPEITTRENALVSGDYPGLVSSWLERDKGGIVLFGLGLCGSQSPRPCEAGFIEMERFSSDLYSSLEQLQDDKHAVEVDRIEVREQAVKLPIQNAGYAILFKAGIFNRGMVADGSVVTTISKVRLGTVDILHVPGEPFPGLLDDLLDAENRREPRVQLVISQSNDALGYFIPHIEFKHKATKWQDPAGKKRFTGHEDESIGFDASTRVRDAVKAVFRYKTVLAIGAHADDLTIWAGGTLALLSMEGNRVICVRVCDDWEDCVGTTKKVAIERNQREADAAYKALGASEVIHLMYPSDYLHDSDYTGLRERIVRLIRKFKPGTVISFDLNGTDEENQDHVIVAKAVNEACWQASFDALYPEHFDQGLRPHAVAERLLFARNPAVVNHIVDISQVIDAKVAAICHHETVLMNFFHQYRMLAASNGLTINLLEKPHEDRVKVNLLTRLVYSEWGEKIGTLYAEPFNKIDAGLLKKLSEDE